MGVVSPSDMKLAAPGAGRCARVERERRYLLRGLPPGLKLSDPHTQVTDNYVTGTRLRLRKVRTPETNEWALELTQKQAPEAPGFARALVTDIQLSPYEYEVLSVFEGNELRKNRYPYEHGGRVYYVDVFLGPLRGLVLAGTYFDDDEELGAFPAPPFAHLDVTRDELFDGARLVGLTAEDLRGALEGRTPDPS